MRTSELTERALDWAVSTCEGYTDLRWNHEDCVERFLLMTPPTAAYGPVFLWELGYSTDWSQAGPIIEREKIGVAYDTERRGWSASFYEGDDVFGGTPLIAAMRCYVASKLGAEIELPEELT